MKPNPALTALLLASILALAGACGISDESGSSASETTSAGAASDEDESEPADPETSDGEETNSTFVAEVWADNWFALYANGELVGEDSVPITTERSFNAETISFEAAYPLTIAIEAKDYIETDMGLEYIGEPNQQMGDGGIIAQITDTASGEVVAVTSGEWSAFVVHRAPLNTECEGDADPEATCEFEIVDAPAGWTAIGFDTSAWSPATVWTAADVDPKDGYDEIVWDTSAELVWGPDLEVDNTILLLTTINA
ncbi:MAG: PEBP family protein [Acidimicrobiales bacterium]